MSADYFPPRISGSFFALFLLCSLITSNANAELWTLPRVTPLYSLSASYDQPTYSSQEDAIAVGCSLAESPVDCNPQQIQGPYLSDYDKNWWVQVVFNPHYGPFPYYYWFRVYSIASKECPANSTLAGYGFCKCNSGFGEAFDPVSYQDLQYCKAYSDLDDPKSAESRPEEEDAGMCTPNPIIPAAGIKYRHELDWVDTGPAPLSFSRIYRSSWSADTQPVWGLDPNWNHNHAIRFAASSQAIKPVHIVIGDPGGGQRSFYYPDPYHLNPTVGNDRLIALGDGARYSRSDDDIQIDFNSSARVQTRTGRNGWATTYGYNNAGQLTSIANPFGRSLTLGYDSAGRLSTVTTPDSRIIGYSYDNAGRLSTVTYPDGKSRSYLYENNAFPNALTAILDEAGVRWGNFVYDGQGRAVMSELAGGVERYSVSYSGSNSAVITDPLNTSRSYGYSTKGGRVVVTAGSMRSAYPGADALSRVQDSNGLITSETDFTGAASTTIWDTTRRLPTTVTNAFGTSEARTSITQWHPTFSLPTLVTEPGRATAYSYDAVGNVLTKAVTDTAASPSSTRTWSWTYNAKQLVATATAPNGAVTSYTYDNFGNLLTAANAVGNITTYTYDPANRVASRTEPNGLTTTYTYDLRDRLLTQTVDGQQTTTFTYKPYGSVETVTLPTGLVLTYTYDPAHRLIGWSNNRGDSGTYTLDNMGNRVEDQVKNANGAVAWTTARTINAINRVASATEGGNRTTTFGYDANGEQTSETDGLNQSRNYGLDALRRVKTVTDAANASATLKYNALDAVVEAKDFAGVLTAYGRDAQGNATIEASADVGITSTRYDTLGLPSQVIDALGQATTINRDALGRPIGLVRADGKTTTLRYDLTATSKGYLSELIDRSGTTEYTRDVLGRVVLKKQTLANGSVQQVSYAYNSNGTLASIVYPNDGALSMSTMARAA